MPALLATILTASSSSRSPARGAAPARTCLSIAVRRPSFPSRCRRGRGKKPNPGPTAPPLLLLPRSLLPLWLDRCLHLHALAAAGLALALAASLLPAAHASSSVGARSPLDAAAYPCEDVRRYYVGLDGLAGDELRTKLAAVVSPHAALRYKDVWEALKILDAADAEHPEASSEVIEIYSQRAAPKILAGKPDGWNREHLWPRSYGLTYGPSLTDLHNIRPADVNGQLVNSSRGNKYFGECTATSINCVRPANHEAASDTETDTEKWAPPFQVRGDVARSLMYMAVSYGSGQKDGAPHLELSDSPSIQERWVCYQPFYGGMNLIRHQDLSSLEMTEFATFTSIIEILLSIIQNMQILYGGTLLPKVHLSQENHRRLGSMSSTMKIKAKTRMRSFQPLHYKSIETDHEVGENRRRLGIASEIGALEGGMIAVAHDLLSSSHHIRIMVSYLVSFPPPS
ncbi:uncharacterized protein LOC101762200 isoform X5 [Setaria italica]|uniref:uncharacterized protein LOC101762200 isoform X5 n=1 Tax=Setaria italica TaxID=4555 RepID=UPI000BE51D98|nr:uncharacterized protein LOC101762200 isoform X5 [Setaria italica]XP_034588227.1 uncharacterized protein LOC117850481 isoform X5 [Setaria viridis]